MLITAESLSNDGIRWELGMTNIPAVPGFGKKTLFKQRLPFFWLPSGSVIAYKATKFWLKLCSPVNIYNTTWLELPNGKCYCWIIFITVSNVSWEKNQISMVFYFSSQSGEQLFMLQLSYCSTNRENKTICYSAWRGGEVCDKLVEMQTGLHSFLAGVHEHSCRNLTMAFHWDQFGLL